MDRPVTVIERAGLHDEMADWVDSYWLEEDIPPVPDQVSYIVLVSGVAAAEEARSPVVDIGEYGWVESGAEGGVMCPGSRRTRTG